MPRRFWIILLAVLWAGNPACVRTDDLLLSPASATSSDTPHPGDNSPGDAEAGLSAAEVRRQIDAARGEIAALGKEQRERLWWRVAGAERLLAAGRLEESRQVAEGKRPPRCTLLRAGRLGAILRRGNDGLRLLSFSDGAAEAELLAAEPLALFGLVLRNVDSGQDSSWTADSGWTRVEVRPAASGESVEFRWQDPQADGLQGLRVIARATPDHEAEAIRWSLDVENQSRRWSVQRVAFPQIAVGELAPQAEVFFPRGPGEAQPGLWQREFRYRGTYPNGWTTMQLMAVYHPQGKTGLYFAVHDPLASTKDVFVESRPSDRAVVLGFDHPAAEMGTAGNDFRLRGQAVWRLLRGDWFDAARVYREWVRKQAKWYPELTADGRNDTPRWMRRLPVWVMTGGAPQQCVERVERFARWAGVPLGFHWYNWHRIPFDNDYPHYFPAKDGFAEAVARLQRSGVFVMPYINGRLWDTRDRGTEDFEFGRLALPAATKDEHGEPYVETYGSKETDGSRVRLAAMCPATDLWQRRVREVVLRLFEDFGVKAVYVDQVAAAQPKLCFDASHGHPLGGGAWWTAAYGRMIDSIRRSMPEDRALTTECNAEPYVKWFDGYLTWHWQHEGQVPAFPAVYGGAIQMFGRAYRGGETKNLALRMKAGQQLVFGEQIGWFDPNVIDEQENAEFLRQIIRLRWRLRRYFYAGEMARPPVLRGEIPEVRADWQWSGRWPVSTEAVLTGAWRLPDEKRCVLLLVNVGDRAISAELPLDAGAYGVSGEEVRATLIRPDDREETARWPRISRREVSLPPRTARAWELTSR